MNWSAGLSIPDDGRFALVRDADGGEIIGAYPGIAERGRNDLGRVVPDLERIVLDPAWLRIDLLVLFLGEPHDRTGLVEYDESAARGALVDGTDIVVHGCCSRIGLAA